VTVLGKRFLQRFERGAGFYNEAKFGLETVENIRESSTRSIFWPPKRGPDPSRLKSA
jgi:hypothetical protein